MKKIYKTPSVKVTQLQTVQILALSKFENGGGEVLSREDNAWWDEED